MEKIEIILLLSFILLFAMIAVVGVNIEVAQKEKSYRACLLVTHSSEACNK